MLLYTYMHFSNIFPYIHILCSDSMHIHKTSERLKEVHVILLIQAKHIKAYKGFLQSSPQNPFPPVIKHTCSHP